MTTLQGAPFLADPRLARVLEVLNGAGEETRIVGGAVRNALLCVPVKEVDLATTAHPDETTRRAEAAGLKAVPTGIAHGTVTVVIDGAPFEVTTLREDVETDGRHAVVRFGRDWLHDAQRRDFTMNALFATPDGTVIDLVGGLADLDARKVRFIGDPERRIREDYLRILRLFRFHATYGTGPLDAAALTAAIRCRAGLSGLSRERVRAEMLKLLAAPDAPPTVEAMSDAGFLTRVLGGVGDLPGLRRLAGLERALGHAPDPVLRLAVLAVRVAEDADRLRERLRLTNDEHRRLLSLAEGAIAADMAPRAAHALLYRLGRTTFADRVLLGAARKDVPLRNAQAALALAEGWEPPVFPVRAAHFLERGLKPGPDLGAALARAEVAWIAAGFPQGEEAVAELVKGAMERA
ncbi:CCA tRNA nucleotidyltransferase [Aquabacter sp. CN5-332]|uniref:CCA tRNA nucleotidyltransferase n=1 Tax=Aquabacter sp. CN5-332 TaxID=3156608 RepID=UPI0032B5B30A